MSRWLPPLVLALPPVAAVGLLLAMAIAERTQYPLMAVEPPRNGAEAVALKNAAAVLGFLAAGEDPLLVSPIRPDAISSSITEATLFEAAILSRSVEMVRLLAHEGVLPNLETRQDLACLAVDIEEEGIARVLADGGPVCTPGAVLRLLLERSHKER